MKELYNTITELLEQIPTLKWVDFENGQLQEPQPPITYPAALISTELPSTENIDLDFQQVRATFTVRLVFKALGETNTKAPVSQRNYAMAYFNTVDAVFDKLQGFKNNLFYPFERTAVRRQTVRTGLNVVDLHFETSWQKHSSKS